MEIANIKFEDIKIGDSAEFEVTLTFDDARNFAKLSGDFNPLHLEAEFAANTQFRKPIIQGMLLASLFSRLVGMYLPGKKALYMSQTLVFRNPVYFGDKLFVSGKVTAKSESARIIKILTVIKNEKEQIVLDGEARATIL